MPVQRLSLPRSSKYTYGEKTTLSIVVTVPGTVSDRTISTPSCLGEADRLGCQAIQPRGAQPLELGHVVVRQASGTWPLANRLWSTFERRVADANDHVLRAVRMTYPAQVDIPLALGRSDADRRRCGWAAGCGHKVLAAEREGL